MLAVVWLIRGHRGAGPDIESQALKAERSQHIAEQVEHLTARRHVDDEAWEGTLTSGRAKLLQRAAAMRQAARQQMSVVPETVDPAVEFESFRDAAMMDPDPDDRVDALESAATMFDNELAIPLLKDCLKDSDPEVRLAALDELWLQSDDVPFDEVTTALKDDDPEVRLEAVRILGDGDSDDQRVWSLLETAANDADEDVRSDAQDLIDLNSDD